MPKLSTVCVKQVTVCALRLSVNVVRIGWVLAAKSPGLCTRCSKLLLQIAAINHRFSGHAACPYPWLRPS